MTRRNFRSGLELKFYSLAQLAVKYSEILFYLPTGGSSFKVTELNRQLCRTPGMAHFASLSLFLAKFT